jgi:DNA helicase HerA-like ATPase
MAINPNEELENRHLIAMGMSGSGKTFFLRNHPDIKKTGARIAVFDAYETHKAHFSRSLKDFGRKLASGIRSGKGFRIGLSVEPTPENFEKFCEMVWLAADGNKELIVIVGELADVSKPGKASPAWGKIVRVGRKYGIVLMVETQRPQEIDKTVFTQTGRKWVGYLEPYDHNYVEKFVGLEKGSLAKIEPNSYKSFYKHGSTIQEGGPGKKLKI